MVYGDFPFHSVDINELEKSIVKLKYNLPTNASKDFRNLISRILAPASARITIPEIYKHPWMKNIDESCNLVNNYSGIIYTRGNL